MMSFVCHFYGWTVDYALSMQASRFFVMLEQGRRLQSVKLSQACYVARSSQMTNKAFAETVAIFESALGRKEMPIAPPIEKNPTPALKASSDAAKYAIMEAFAQDKRINRPVTINRAVTPSHPPRKGS